MSYLETRGLNLSRIYLIVFTLLTLEIRALVGSFLRVEVSKKNIINHKKISNKTSISCGL